METGAQNRILRIAHTSDTHSCIEPLSAKQKEAELASTAGFARRVAVIDELREQGEDNLMVFDCGDFSQGSVYYNLFHGDTEVELMNLMHIDACTIGNHEFDFGLENLARLIRKANFPFVCCNYDFTGTPCEGLVKPYIVKERAGVRVGILGVGVQPEGLITQENYLPMRYTEPAKAAQPIINRLRNEEHCDVVICLSHLGWTDEPGGDKEFIEGTTGLDILLGGHTHTQFQHIGLYHDAKWHAVHADHVGKNASYVGLMEIEVARSAK